jgi:hypothetical protein
MADPVSTVPPVKTWASEQERECYRELRELSKFSPIPDQEVLANLGLFLVRASLGRMLFMHNLYRQILNTHGVIMEFGVRWGQNLALFTTLRNLYEPHNQTRKVIGFDTFKGFPCVTAQDGDSPSAQVGAYGVTPGYEDHLSRLLSAHERLAPRCHIKKHELIKGDVVETLPAYLEEHPETIISLAYFDLDLYEPTRRCLELIRPHLARNSIVGFDELVSEEFPGETQALKEAWGLSSFNIVRDPISSQQSYLVVG